MSDFLCGVVEGFYGRPWTIQQRRELFERMKNFGLNTYMYAPKDDEKHRALWRELYDDAEGRVLRQLVSGADQHDVAFIYALSPGIDIRYSDDSELETLKRKLQQVASFGVRRFALLFDDIEPQLNDADAQRFASFAHAHCHVTNVMYNSMSVYFDAQNASHKSDSDENQSGQSEKQNPCMPVFLFCPTEYCSTRCAPNLTDSLYLRTVGSLLDPRINIMWTGPQVVSRLITSAHLEELFNVTRRRCVIWDNLPANDYDQRRLFLGPFSGRSDVDSMRRFARGLLVNPNCEFEANFVPLRTLAFWYHATLCDTDASTSTETNVPQAVETEPEADTRPEAGGTCGSRYSPTRALLDAIREWLAVMRTPKTAAGFCIGTPHRCASPLSICSTGESQSAANKRELAQDDEELPTQPADAEPEVETAREPEMDGFSEYDVHLVVDFFNLPFQYGENASQMLESFRWLRDHADVLRVDDERQPDSDAPPNRQSPATATSPSPVQLELECNYDALSPQSQSATANAECVQMRDVEERPRPNPRPTAAEWRAKAANFREMVQRANSLSSKVTRLRNRALAYDLNPYITELYGTLWVCRSYVDWLAMRMTDARCRETFFAGEHEPWLVRGGILGELQRAVPENDRSSNNARSTRTAQHRQSPARPRAELEADAGVNTPEQMHAAPSNVSAKSAWPQNESTSCSLIRPLLYSELDEERQITNLGAGSLLRFAHDHPDSVSCFVLEGPDGHLGACCIGLVNANAFRSFTVENGTQETEQEQRQAEARSPFQWLNDERYPSFVKLLISPENERPNGELVRLLRCTLNYLRVTRGANAGVYTAISNDAPFGVSKHISIFEQVGLVRVRGEPPKTPNDDEQNATSSKMDSDGTQPADCYGRANCRLCEEGACV